MLKCTFQFFQGFHKFVSRVIKTRPARAPTVGYGELLRGNRSFRLLWLGQIISVTGSQMQMVAINWHIYLITHSALALGMVGFFRAGPIILCSLLGGVVADVTDRRRLMMVTQSVMLTCSAILALITFGGLQRVWPIFLLTSIASAAWAFDRDGFKARAEATLAELNTKRLADSRATLARLDEMLALGIVGLKEYGASHPKYAKLMDAAIADSQAMKRMTDVEIEEKWGEKVPVLLDGGRELCHYFLDLAVFQARANH